MAAWWRSCLWLCLCWSVATAVVPEGDGGGGGLGLQEEDGEWAREGPECPSSCSCSMPREVTCIATSGSDYPPNPAVDTTRLELEGYHVIPTTLLARLKHLTHLDISGSQIQDLTDLPSLPQLTVLDLQHNHLWALGDGLLHTKWPKLTHLWVGHNNVTTVTDTDLTGLDQLQELDLSNNPIIEVGVGALKDLTVLTTLDISHSQLLKLPHRWLTDALNLQYLNISGSALRHTPRLTGQRLKVVDVSHNAINKLPNGFLAGAGALEELLLYHNPLIHVHAEAMAGGVNLLQLDLHHTHLVNMDEFVLLEVPNVRELRLDHNTRLKRVEHGAFTGLHKLQHLNIANTPNLHEIEEVAFAGLPNLKTLDLRNSGLSVLPRSLALLVKYNTSVFLADTAISCECHNYWLPDLLMTSNISSWSGVNPVKCVDGTMLDVGQLAAHIQSLNCVKPVAATHIDGKVTATKSQGALLECNVTANPPHKVLWLSATNQVFRYNGSEEGSGYTWLGHRLQQAENSAVDNPRYQVQESGDLLIREVLREDVGWYKCFAYNSVGNTTVLAFLTLSDAPFRALYVESLLFGFACAALFLFITLLVQLINYLMDRLGCECCCCCKGRVSHKARQVRRLLESVEIYKSQQLERLRENYNGQVVSIKESCYSQMERIRDSYSVQGRNLKDLREYSTQGLTSIRDQYVDQVNKVRDYSMSQMNRVRENYVFQRHRIRKFSAHQLLRLRETYKYQQKTLNKILENLPDLYLQNCRTGGCQRTDSILFDDALHDIDAYYKVDFLDSQSHHSSDYYTPASTLTRSFRSNRGHEPVRQHSRTSSNTSSDFVEAQPWPRRESSTLGMGSPSRTLPTHVRGQHSRSLSVTGSASFVTDPVRVHKRSLSACHPSYRVAPAPESRGVPARITLREELSDGAITPPSPSAPSSVPATPTHLTQRRLVLNGSHGEVRSYSPTTVNNLQHSTGSVQGSVMKDTERVCGSDTNQQDRRASDSDINSPGSQEEATPLTNVADETGSTSSAFETSL
ncbi:hypothetical protein Pmani_019022 [Petrolisthes manimaculis]|uniref:Ig-like domain-containing protein n=1 Tax=Petrolisthes manimaculis TaxID=1843537 RepID=A0AAE1PIZ9_9EUCA|nr:hypothetical protein Pmani_019022 [Petrolisthes manimaculis]